MALSFMIRRAASSPVLPLPLATRAVSSPRTFLKAISKFLNISKPIKDEDAHLLRVIDTEIKSKVAVKYKIPKNFPFDVKDNYSENGTIELEREYLDELILVEVDLAVNESDEYESDSDSSSNSDYDSESNTRSDNDSDSDTNAKSDESRENSAYSNVVRCIPLSVNVCKGSNLSLELELYVEALPDEISITSLAVRESKDGVDAEEKEIVYDSPEFGRLDDKVKEALHRYLELRGIDVSMANFLHQYWNHKQSVKRILWMKKLKKFIKT